MAAAFRRQESNPVPSSSPAFGTPVHPINPRSARPIPQPAFKPTIATILPILLPPPSLRPLAFRTFTKKHNLTLSSPALQSLATFVGRHCGSGWREDGTAEKVLDEVAKTWKKSGGPLIVEEGSLLKNILKTLEGCMSGGKIVQTNSLSRQSSFAFTHPDDPQPDGRPSLIHQGSSFGLSGLQVEEEEDEQEIQDPRSWLKVVDAYTQPRLLYDTHKKHFERVTTKPSLLPSPAHKTALFRDRYNIIHQRLMRSEAFQAPSVNTSAKRTLGRSDTTSLQQYYKLTPIANLLGRSGTSHVLLGLLTVAPTGTLALNDMTGSITLDLQHAKPMRGEDCAWFCPGMILLIEGIYEEEYGGAGSSGLGQTTGVGGTIGGKFIGFMISGPPSERRNLSLGVADNTIKANPELDLSMGGGFGWTDFLGLGSEKALGPKMRRLEQKLLGPDSPNPERRKIVLFSEVNLDDPSSLEALRTVLKYYSTASTADADPSTAPALPLSFVLIGNFVAHPVMAGGGSGGSIDYKEYFNDLATVLADFPVLLRTASWIFVPGDNDPWPSAFSAGASVAIPRAGVPDLFTTRVKRAFAAAKSEPLPLGAPATSSRKEGSAVEGSLEWTTNPARVTLFGSAHEIVVFRDDISARLRRTAITFGKANRTDDPESEDEFAADEEAMQIAASGAVNDQAIEQEMADEMHLDNDDNHNQDRSMPPPPQRRKHQLEAETEVPTDSTTAFARKIILSLLPQSNLSPFPMSTRPVHWDYGAVLSLYPLPHTLVLADAEAPPFALTFEGCHVVNPGRLVREEGKRRRAGWVEYDGWTKRGEVKGMWF